jgi:hypothetical protein
LLIDQALKHTADFVGALPKALVVSAIDESESVGKLQLYFDLGL